MKVLVDPQFDEAQSLRQRVNEWMQKSFIVRMMDLLYPRYIYDEGCLHNLFSYEDR